jgi:hypothetical protein
VLLLPALLLPALLPALPLCALVVACAASARSTGGSWDSDAEKVADTPPPRATSSVAAAASPTSSTTATNPRRTRSLRVPTSGGRNIRHGQRPQRSAPRRCSWALSE